LAWSASGKEVFFTASSVGAGRSLHAVTLDGKLRVVAKIPGALHLHDISRTGRVLVARDNINMGMTGWREGDTNGRDLSWFDWSRVVDVTPDGRLLLFDESGEGAGPRYATYVHRTKTGENVRIGDGFGLAISPNGRWVLSVLVREPGKALLQPIGAGEAKVLLAGGLNYMWAHFFPDSTRLLVCAKEPGKVPKLYIQSIASGKLEPVRPEIPAKSSIIAPDGQTLAVSLDTGKLALFPIANGEARVLDLPEPMTPINYSQDGQWIFAHGRSASVPQSIFRINVQTGKADLWKQVSPPDREGVALLSHVQVAEDGKAFYYSHYRNLSDLFIVEGWDNK